MTNQLDGISQSYDVVDTGPVRRRQPVPLRRIVSPVSVILVMEENGDTKEAEQIGVAWDSDSGEEGWTNILFAGHRGVPGTNYLFADGHVKRLSRK